MKKIKIDKEVISRIVNNFKNSELIEFKGYEGMIIFRPHRGGVVFDSLKKAKEFNNIQEMKEYMVKQWNNLFSVDDIVIIGKPVNDDRIGWQDSRCVCVKRLGDEDYISKYGTPQCIGYCATDWIK